MSHHWPNRLESGGGGILRKNHTHLSETKPIDLLVFGYACKVFRDDVKARDIDQGKHLIPWNGDENLRIDRYDVRATLYDLNPYEPPAGGYVNRLDYLTPEEQRAEQLCEVERYRSLYHNEEEEKLYQEEELKRLQADATSSSYSQVQFSYDGSQNENSRGSTDSKEDEADSAFAAPKNLIVPEDIQVPETMKQHAIIERTAKFISSEGMQMEIFIKAKQSKNSQFEFLNINDCLNPYYKFVLESLKNGSYKAEEDGVENSKVTAKDETTVPSNIVYVPEVIRPIVPIKYTPSADCSYTQLISKIKGVPLPPEQPAEDNKDNNFTPVLLQYNSLYPQNDGSTTPNVEPPKSNGAEIKTTSNALMLAQYYTSGSEDEDTSDAEQPVLDFPQPPDYLQNIIDKTATYVIKNGRQFEDTLRKKTDDRFKFLYSDNEYYSYYMYKITGVAKNLYKNKPTKNGSESKSILPVSFSIKGKEDSNQSVIRPALPQEGSDDERKQETVEEKPPPRRVPEHVQKVIQLVEKQLQARNMQMALNNASTSPVPPVVQTVPNKPENQQQKELKRAEEKVKDKLAQIAREKLGLISKEKQLQLERKKKAQAFLTQIKAKTADAPPPPTWPSDNSPPPIHTIDSDSDNYSVHSIPISGYGDKTDEESSTHENDIELIIEPKRQSRSKSRSKSKSRHKSKKKSSKHSKKKSKKRSRSSSRSRSPGSPSPERKRKKRSSSRKHKKASRSDR